MINSCISVQYDDKETNSLAVFETDVSDAKVFIILPAMGVRASFYKHLASKIVEQGNHAVSVDWRGQGESSVRARKGVDYSYKDLIKDLRVNIQSIKSRFPNSEPIIIGHSLGGQLGSLLISRYPELVNKMSIIAACSVYYKGWDGLDAVKIKVVGYLFYRLANLFGYFPGDRLGFGGREFPKVMRDWGNNALTGKYDLMEESFDYEKALSESTASIKAFSVDGDWLAPARAMKNLIEKFGKNAAVEHTHLTKAIIGKKLSHFSWAKKSDKVVELLTDW